jgi:hypothetical protein
MQKSKYGWCGNKKKNKFVHIKRLNESLWVWSYSLFIEPWTKNEKHICVYTYKYIYALLMVNINSKTNTIYSPYKLFGRTQL